VDVVEHLQTKMDNNVLVVYIFVYHYTNQKINIMLNPDELEKQIRTLGCAIAVAIAILMPIAFCIGLAI
jgi:hypothetical protein